MREGPRTPQASVPSALVAEGNLHLGPIPHDFPVFELDVQLAHLGDRRSRSWFAAVSMAV
jgi:hypothetical protein